LRSAVFLDRDGVINQAIVKKGRPFPPRTIEEFALLPDVSSAIATLRECGLIVVVVTNQPDISSGLISLDFVNQVHNEIKRLTGIEEFYVCPHLDFDDCDCRKPKPGLLHKAAKDLDLDLKSSYMVGDRWKDIQAGNLAECQSFFIDYSYNEKTPNPPFHPVGSLLQATEKILRLHHAK
jgi:D-glycero-D-manno-heptose 1,7-bisphosphate phosphatase